LVVHCGIGPNRGHYIAVVKRDGSWLVFDDETVDVRISLVLI
jgi:ubiquitin carboxyl-terminal hydrolase 12/46